MTTPVPYQRERVLDGLSRTVAHWLLPCCPQFADAWVPRDHELSLAVGVAHGASLIEGIQGELDRCPRMAVELVAWGWYLGRLGGLIERPGGWERTP